MAGISGAYENFKQAIKNKAPDTVITYDEALKHYRDSQGFSDYEDLTADTAKDIQERIKNYIEAQTHSKASKVLKALKKFYAANQIIINWEYVYLFKPAKEDKVAIDQPYSMDQMITFYKHAALREQTAALVMGTGMPRIGALPDLKIERDLIWVEKYKLYAGIIYFGTSSQYMTFFSPQASEHIDELKGKRKEGYLFANKRENDLPADRASLQNAIWKVLVKSGLRIPGEKTERHEVQMDHGFRKFGRTALGNAEIELDYAEALEGHGKQLVRIYDRPTAEQWLERTKYYRAIPNLTLPV